jgi:hypothetical protein
MSLRIGLQVCIGHNKRSSSSSWSSLYYILKSGDTWYRRERNTAGGYFILWFSPDAGVTWEELLNLDITESDPVIDLTHQYRHRIVDDEYHVDQTLTATGYAGTEGVDWENLFVADSWSSYWKAQTEVLFFGLYSDISGGQMPNKVDDGATYLTVAGSAGSETYQCPNTAPYIAADTDYIWFNDDGTQRTTTTAELIGYDLQRTPVRYEDDAPNTIQAIMILKSGETITGTLRDKMFRDFRLSPWWDDSFNDYGRIKSNRSGEQLLWTPELTGTIIDTFTDDDAVTLASHTMDKGGGVWTNVTYIFDILGNKARYNGSGAYAQAYVASSGDANPDIWVTLTIPDEANYIAGFVIRRNGNSTQWRVMVIRSAGGTPTIKIFKYTTEVATVDITHVAGDGVLRCVVTGNNFDVYWKGNKVIDTYVSDGSWNTVQNHGIITYRDASYKQVLFNDFIIK